MIKRFVVIFSFISICVPALADTFKSEDELKPFVESVMKKVAVDDLTGAFKLVRPYLAVGDSEFQLAELNSKNQNTLYSSRYGFPVGVEFIEQKKVGESLIRVVYIEKTEKQALPWVFYFYKPSTVWIFTGFKWSDQLFSGLFDEK
ncbi:hypothetical protein [Rugamonas rivuli]|uniref:DUF3887 domain-containing protein n=1 Tax=Rugamonas rivuli TaxID=2743358 RepID=A0A843SNS6_9BURK|nr:hypothetical protein [Rugamonas rivuli]MQA23660.1 hypothetical protein [Rugamonas rivuli]